MPNAANEQIGTIACNGSPNVLVTTGRPITWSMTAAAEPQRVSDFEAALLAMAGHDLRQPLQVVQSVHDRLGIGLRTKSELRLLQLGQSAIDRLTEQLNLLLEALRLYEHSDEIALLPVSIDPLLRQACRDNEEIASRKNIEIRMVPSSLSVTSNALLLGAALRNLISNAIKYTLPGGRILLGCRRSGQRVRIDVYDTGIGIRGEHMPRVFEAFTRLDTTRRDGLGIGLFIVRQAIGLLGHRVEVSSATCRGSRFSIVAARAGEAAA